ncbi:MAG TPA: FkbM family methyltransferase [Bacteroidia bacterium]|nr:FkbM family methyltransferase [Bacteroidia bacterium]
MRKLIGKLMGKQNKSEPPKLLRDTRGYKDCTQTIDTLLKHYRPTVLFDIGAHNGSWSQILLETLQNDIPIVMFEPQKSHFENLQKLFGNKTNKFLFNVALGSALGKSQIQGGGASASLLNASNLQNEIFPGSFNESITETVDVFTLDEIIEMHKLILPDVIKIDVQGFELDVFKGGQKTLKQAKYLIVELSFISLYTGQPSLNDILLFLEKNNFVIVDFGFQWRNNKDEIVQIDAILKNTGI